MNNPLEAPTQPKWSNTIRVNSADAMVSSAK